MESVVLRPNRRVFVFRPVIRTAVVGAVLLLLVYLILSLFQLHPVGPVVWLIGYGLVVGLVFMLRQVRYKKTSYTLMGDRVVHKTGGLFSEETTDLQYPNITQVRLRLPFIEHRFFSTGRLTIRAAGSAVSEVVFNAIDEPRRLYEEVGKRMQAQGFSLRRGELLQQESPNVVGCVLDMGSFVVTFGVTIFGILIWGSGVIIDVLALDGFGELIGLLTGAFDDYGADWDVATMRRVVWGLGLMGVVAVVWSIVAGGLHFVDLTRRTYTLHDDVVDYEDGFLTETHEFIPIENLTDAEINEPFLKRFLGVADVMLSCQGAGSHIRFTSMPNAQGFKDQLARLIEREKAPLLAENGGVGEPMSGIGVAESDGSAVSSVESVRPARVVRPSGPRIELKMNFVRAIAGPITGLLVLVMIVLTAVIFLPLLAALFVE
ncbi:MAG: PH domain-containing protein, partial [Bradymonadaceae bacterium]